MRNARPAAPLRRAFTMIEILVVVVLIGLASALVLPKVGGVSRRMTIESGLSGIRAAFTEAALRARASGKAIALRLDPEEHRFTVTEWEDDLDKSWKPEIAEPLQEKGVLQGETEYPLSEEITWTELPEILDEERGIVYGFFPDGSATGPEASFQLAGVSFRLTLDSVLGKLLLQEEE